MSNMDRIFSEMGASSNSDVGNGRRYGVDLAKITNINDPDKLNRVKCKRVTNDADVGETDWMYVAAPLAGAGYGLYAMPKVGDLVLLSYLGGDPHRPFVIGSVWTKDVVAPYKIDGGKNETVSLKLPSGTEVLISETKGKESLSVRTAAGYAMNLDGENKKIVLTDDKNKNQIDFDMNSGAVTVSADKKLTLKAGANASIEMDGTAGKIVLNGKSGIEIKTAQLKAEATGTCQIKANGQMSVESSGITQVKGSMVKIN